MLRLINRLQEPTLGSFFIDDEPVRAQSAIELRRKIGYVLQEPALFPHWTVAKNIGLVPRLLKWQPEAVRVRVDELLEMIRMDPATYRDRHPAALSGGEQQRVGIARALAANPKIMLFDEPFSALDPITRSELQQEVLALKAKFEITIVFVTHDVREAFLLADDVLILEKGEIAQYAAPEEIKARPATAFIENFIRAAYAD